MQKWPLHPHQTCKNLAETAGEAAGAAGEAGSRGHGGEGGPRGGQSTAWRCRSGATIWETFSSLLMRVFDARKYVFVSIIYLSDGVKYGRFCE